MSPDWNSSPRDYWLYPDPRPLQPSRMTGLRYCTGPGCGSRVRVVEGTRTPCPRCKAPVTFGDPRTR